MSPEMKFYCSRAQCWCFNPLQPMLSILYSDLHHVCSSAALNYLLSIMHLLKTDQAETLEHKDVERRRLSNSNNYRNVGILKGDPVNNVDAKSENLILTKKVEANSF